MTRKLGRFLPDAPAVAFEAFDALMFAGDEHIILLLRGSVYTVTQKVEFLVIIRHVFVREKRITQWDAVRT